LKTKKIENFFIQKLNFMKRIILLSLFCGMFAAVNAQDKEETHYSVSGGLLANANFSQFRTDNSVDYKTKTGWGLGGWVNIPVSEHFSIEPQLSFQSLQFQTSNTTLNLLMYDGKIRYFSIPLLLKYNAGEHFAITFGPQFDFRTSIEDNNNVANKEDFKGSNISLTAGLEVFPRGKVSIFGRYAYGFSNIDDRASHDLSMEYKIADWQLGLKFKFFGKKTTTTFKAATVTAPVRGDTDGDGIYDDEDKCPTQAGTLKYNGCPVPDTDGDGINDELDKCPTVAGVAKYDGCPIPDTDGDGINDEEDKCPTQAGPKDRMGCPVLDRDNDGVPDEADKCPDIAGLSSNNGCPEVPANVSKSIGLAASGISFGTNNAKLTTKSNTSLDKVVTIMNENPGLKIRIEGHTDNSGSADANMKMSEDRAAAVKAYLVSKGIAEDRIITEGFGGTQPIADNGTAAGRMKNRRIELRMVY
jgi:outer membrane protein OmpA-like peptidoglycan-associated protein